MAQAQTTKRDHVDRFLDEIRAELPPDLDLDVEGIVDRIHGIDWRIRKMLDETLEQYDLSSSDWKVLCSCPGRSLTAARPATSPATPTSRAGR
jgi:hypothetical protein